MSCSFNKHETSLEQLKSKSNTNIKATVLMNDSIIWSDYLVDIINNKLIIQNFKTDYAFSFFSIENNHLIKEKEVVRKGNGPFEMIYPACFVDQTSKRIYFYDINDAYITIYEVETLPFERIYQTSTWTKDLLSDLNGYFWCMNGGFAMMNDSTYIALGGTLDKGNMLTFVQKHSHNVIDSNINFPKDNNEAENMIKRQVYNNGGLKKRPTGNQFLYYCLEGNYAEIITVESLNKATRKVLVNDLPVYSTASNGINPKGDDNNLRGLKAYTTQQYIYLMPYPLRHKDFVDKDNYKGYPTYYNDIIYVFNWSGDFVNSYTLDQLINTFVVTDDDTSIFASSITKNGEYQIVKFSLL